MTYAVTVNVRLRPGIADPEGSTIERALPALGFEGVTSVTVGKSIAFSIDADSEEVARQKARDMCDRFLTNPVIEDADISVVAA